MAAEAGNVELTKELIRRGDDVNEADTHGWTPLAWAVHGNGEAVVPILVRAGANVNQSSDGRPLLLGAIYVRHEIIGRQLLISGANVNTRDEKDAYTALMLAVELNQLEFVQMFLDYGADPHITAPDGADALTLAVAGGSPHDDHPLRYCHTSCVRLLVKRYPGLAIPKTPWGERSVQRAREAYCDEILNMIHRQ